MTAAWQTWALRAAALALVGSLVPPALGLARLFPPPPPAPDVTPSLAVPAQPGPPSSDLGVILEAAPFGRAPDTAAADSALAEGGDAIGGLSLVGITVAAVPAASRAMIGGGIRGAVALYGPGDAVAEGITLTAVQPDGITLDAGGQALTLGFPVSSDVAPAATAAPAAGLIDFSGTAAPPAGKGP
jgi:hypothetical protein